MKKFRGSLAVKWISAPTLLVCLCLGTLITDGVRAQGLPPKGEKVSDELREMARARRAQERVRVVVQLNDSAAGPLDSLLLLASGGRVTRRFRALNTLAVELPARAVEALAAWANVKFVTPDRPLLAFGHVSATTGADVVRTAAGTNTAGLDGTGIGIAVLDSGIDTDHKAFLDRNNGLRVVFSKDFTGENRVDDPYGHGTHVASIAAGNARISNAQYTGVAPNANIINLRVLGATGAGSVSAVLAALDWVMLNRAAYNIRVVNMSLGAPAVDSYKNDPVCRAVRRLVDAGVVVVAAAGNNGKTGAGQKVYGQIHSPGNEPSAVTVGASNTYGTDARGDDVVTTYSSRGPTRSYTTTLLGLKRYDNLVKPDIVAPGNKLIYAEALDNLIVRENPSLDAGVSPVDNRKMMYMNGSSMATPVAAGAAALVLQANPSLTPNLVKAILMYTAQPLAGYNMLEQGAGQLNIEGAVRLARLVRTDLTAATPVGAPLLTTSSAPLPQTTISGHTFNWSRGIVLHYGYATGLELVTKYQAIYNVGVLIGDGGRVSFGVLIGDTTKLSSGVLIGDSITTSSGVLIGDGVPFITSGVLIGDGGLLGDGVLIGDGVLMGDGVLIGDSVFRSDAMTQAMSATTSGDGTLSMPVVEDTGVDYLGY